MRMLCLAFRRSLRLRSRINALALEGLPLQYPDHNGGKEGATRLAGVVKIVAEACIDSGTTTEPAK
jgi:hypothetical protein